ncbi:MAG: bacterial proteasome activator family protein [Acidimicrobiia bacterium]|nr:bacterial proteasome activator family protein [Acidimicrobiia bacterium]
MTDLPQPETPEIVEHPAPQADNTHEDEERASVSEPAKVMRIGTMIKQLLEEVRSTELDEPGRDRLREIYETSVSELASSLSPDLREELERLALPFDADDIPSGAELRVAQAQLVGWLEGLFHGIQATLFAQQAAARQQLEQMHRAQQGLPTARTPNEGPGSGVYL